MLGEFREDGYYIEGLKYEFPTQPKPKDIINYGLPKQTQKWNRIAEYERYDWSKGWEERLEENQEQLTYLIEEVERLKNGVWIYINGEAVYLNNYMYFFLQWFLLEDGNYPNFRDTALYYYRFIEVCDKAKLCGGHTLLKARRLGATSMTLSAIQLMLLITTDSNFGIVSNKGNNASKAFQRAVKSMGNLPVFLRPTQEGNTAPKKVLSLKEQSQRITKNNKSGSSQKGLNNELSWENTDMNSYDSYALRALLLDEGGKYPRETPINKYLQIVVKTLKKGAIFVGKILMPTTCNPPSEGGAEYRVVWDNSDQNKIGESGQTKSSLYRIFIPAYYGFDGFIDSSGNSVWDTPTEEQRKYLESTGTCPNPNVGAKQYLESIRKQLEGDAESLQEEIRMNPFTAEEVFETSNNRCLFNVNDINNRLRELEEKLLDKGLNPLKDELGRRGWFHKSPSGKVHFVDDPKGLWYVHKLLEEDQANRYKIVNGKKIPTNEELGAAGLDPIASGDATVDKGSDSSCIIRSRYTSMNPDETGIPMAMFLGRMANIDKLNEQVFNGLQYYGVKMLAERSQLNWLDYAVREGLQGYLYGTTRSDGSVVFGQTTTSSASRDEHAEVQIMSSLHDHDKIPFIRLVRDRKDFDINNRLKYDSALADGYCLMAMKIPVKKIAKTQTYELLRKGSVTTY
jgi:hypothetical protein